MQGTVPKVMSVALIEFVEMTATLNVVVSINSTTVMQTYWTAPVISISVFYSRTLDKLHFHRVQLRIMGICLFVFLLQIPGLLRLHRL